ncbi:MAG: hypothetical protein JXM70_04530 [Pirellulales bacterium]|nr:hypothetical protein [Pirellulales bacterium]
MRASKGNSKGGRDSASLLGIGFDGTDGHVRLTRGKNFHLVGGSEQTHAVMQETAIKINEHVDRAGMRLEDVSREQISDICNEVRESYGQTDEKRLGEDEA